MSRRPRAYDVPTGLELVFGPLRRARFAIATIAVIHIVGVLTGAVMVRSQNRFALHFMDKMVSTAWKTSPILHDLGEGAPFKAASLDTLGNASSALGELGGGYCLPVGYAMAFCRGWIGGIVSVDYNGQNRLTTQAATEYYLAVMVLQLIGFILAGGAGINIGLASFCKTAYSRVKWSVPPRQAVTDAIIIYLCSLPFFAAGSLIEFTWKQ